MSGHGEILLVLLLVLDLFMVSTSRMDACIRTTVLQAIILAIIPFTLGEIGLDSPPSLILHAAVISLTTLAVKAVIIPILLLRSLRKLDSNREFEPFVSLHYSQLINGMLCGAAFWIAAVLPWPAARGNTLAFGTGIATLLIGLYMTVNRKKALSQVLGYLVIESGLFVIAWTLLGRPSLLIDLGGLLDLLVAVMVLGVLATRIDAAADHAEPAQEEAEP